MRFSFGSRPQISRSSQAAAPGPSITSLVKPPRSRMPTCSRTALHSSATASWKLVRRKLGCCSGLSWARGNQVARSQPPRAQNIAPLDFSLS